MNRNSLLIFITVILLLLIIGGGYWYYIGTRQVDDVVIIDEDDTAIPETDENTLEDNEAEVRNMFQVDLEGDLIANITTSESGNITSTARVEYDDAGLWRMLMDTEQGEVEMIYTPENIYFKDPSAGWMVLPSATGSFEVDPNEFRFDDNWRSEWEEAAEFVDTEVCPDGSGQCNVFVYDEVGATSTVFINSENYHIIRYERVEGNQVTEVNYVTNEEVDIEIPQV